MDRYCLSHLADGSLLEGLTRLLAKERLCTAEILAHMAEVDARELYLPAAYPSMFEYSVRELGLSEDAAYKRIEVARLSRTFPAILAAIESGRLHLTGALLIGRRLTPQNADELLEAAAHRTKHEIELLLAERFPATSVTGPTAPAVSESCTLLAPERVSGEGEGATPEAKSEAASDSRSPTPCAPDTSTQRPARVTPLAPGAYELRVVIDQRLHDQLRHAQDLLAHSVPRADLARVLERALDELVRKIEGRKYGAVGRPRSPRKADAPSGPQRPTMRRTIPAAVRRAVRARDGEQCTFVSADGRRCCARGRLEFDHIVPVARGGESTVDNLRLRCRAHNQFEADRAFGAGFMASKRAGNEKTSPPGTSRAPGRVDDTSPPSRSTKPVSDLEAPPEDLSPWLRRLGFRDWEIRRMSAKCAGMPAAPLEARLRVALAAHRPT